MAYTVEQSRLQKIRSNTWRQIVSQYNYRYYFVIQMFRNYTQQQLSIVMNGKHL